MIDTGPMEPADIDSGARTGRFPAGITGAELGAAGRNQDIPPHAASALGAGRVHPGPRHASGLWFAGALVVVHVRAADSDGRVGVWESVESRGDRLPLHVHGREDEQAFLLEGEMSVWVGDRVHHLKAPETVALPRGVPHAHRVTSEKARILTVATPGGFERLFTDFGVPALPGATAPPRPDDAALGAAAGLLGVRIVGPPPEVSH